MDDLAEDLGSSIALTHHRPVFNAYQEISDEEDVESTKWKPKTSLSIQDSMGRPTLLSWASEMSMYDGQSNHSRGNHTPSTKNVNSNRYKSALDLMHTPQGKTPQKLCQSRNVTFGKQTGVRQEKKLNFVLAAKGIRVSSDIEVGPTKTSDIKDSSSPESPTCLSKPWFNNGTKNDKDVIVSADWGEKPCLFNCASQEDTRATTSNLPVLKRANMIKEPLVEAVVSIKPDDQPSCIIPTIKPVSPNISQQTNDIPVSMTVSPPPQTSSPSHQISLSENSSEILPGDSNYHSEWRSQHEKALITGYKKEIKILRNESKSLKNKITIMMEQSRIVEKNLREENARLRRELLKCQRAQDTERVCKEEVDAPRSSVEGIVQQSLSIKKLNKIPFSSSCADQSIRTHKPSEMKSSVAKVIKLANFSTPIVNSPMDVTSPSHETHFEDLKVTVETCNGKMVKKENNINTKIELIQPGVDNKKEASSSNSKRCSTNKRTTSRPDVQKNNNRNGNKKMKEKLIKRPEFDFKNLIVNYLPPKMDSANLQRIFSKYGEIVSCKVVRNHKTGLSKGYGFVKFKTEYHANLAASNMDQYQIGGKTLKVACARKPERGKQENRQTNLYIANLDKNIETSDIKRVFSSCGYIVQCKVLKDARGVTRRIAFVRFDTHENALRAINRYDKTRMENTKSVIQVRFANDPIPPQMYPKLTKLQMESPTQHSGQFMSSLMSQADSPQYVLPFTPNSPHGYGGSYSCDFIPPASPQLIFSSSPRDAGLENSYNNDSSQTDDFSPLEKSESLSAACYVAGINATTKEADLKKTFDPEGLNRIKSVRVIRRRAGPYAFINFFHKKDALEAVKTFNQTQMGPHTLTVRLR